MINFDPNLVSDLTIHEDDWSFQIKSNASKLFFVRLQKSRSRTDFWAFSDFRLVAGESSRSTCSFKLLEALGYQFDDGTVFEFSNILPAQKGSVEGFVFENREQHFLALINEAAANRGLIIESMKAEMNNEKLKVTFKFEAVQATKCEAH